MMKSWTTRQNRRYSSAGLFLLFFVVIFYLKFVSRSSNENDRRDDLAEFCDEKILENFFIRDQKNERIRSDFTYQLNNSEFCRDWRFDALVFVISKSKNFESRQAIRRTWGNFQRISSLEQFSRLRLGLLFLVDIDESRLLNVELEENLFRDLVQVRLPEQYFLSTFRDISILHWTQKFCPQAKLTFKTDDDIFINTFLLANSIEKILKNFTDENAEKSSAEIFGIQIRDARVVRFASDPILEGTRYIAAYDEFPCKFYPDYMSGFGYFVNRDARRLILSTFFRQTKLFFMSDVYVTGILPEYLRIPRRNLRLKISFRSTDDCEQFFSEENEENFACASSAHYRTNHFDIFERFNAFWHRISLQQNLYLNRDFSNLFE